MRYFVLFVAAAAWRSLVIGLQGVLVEEGGVWELVLDSGAYLRVRENPWGLSVYNANKSLLLQDDGMTSSLGLASWWELDFTRRIYEGYSWRLGKELTYYKATRVAEVVEHEDALRFRIVTTDPLGAEIILTVQTDVESSHFHLHFQAEKANVKSRFTRLGWGLLTSADDGYFGFGERFNSVNLRGEELYCWVEDGGWSLGISDVARLPKVRTETYVPMPYFLSPRGYAFLVDTTYRTNWNLKTADVHNESASGAGFFFEAEALSVDVRIFVEDTPLSALKRFTEFKGRSLIPPMWEFGPWNTFANEISGADKYEAVRHFIAMDVPVCVHLDNVHFFPLGSQKEKREDIEHMTHYNTHFGIHTFAYFNSMVDTSYYPVYNECESAGFFVNNSDSTTYTFIYKGAGPDPFYCAVLDFSNQAAVRWYQSQMSHALELGYKGFMYDYGEYIDRQTVSHDGTTGEEMHNLYPLLYQKAAFDFFERLDDDPNDAYAPDFVYYVRSGYTGMQKYTWAHWTGDPMSDWSPNSGLPSVIKAQLTLGISGMPFSGSDISGFVWWLPPTLELWIRWSQAGLFSSIMHVQGGGTDLLQISKTEIHDWAFGDYVWRKLAKLRTSLTPYVYTLAHEAHFDGIPLLRHHILSFPNDAEAITQEYQYCFGSALLVAPVVEDRQRRQSVYLPVLPEGEEWLDLGSSFVYDLEDGRHRIAFSPVHEGGAYVQVDAPLDTVPLFVRTGSIIPTFDPSVDTINEAKSELVVTLSQRAHVLHLWVWPTVTGFASGSAYDGSEYQLSNSTTLLFSVTDPSKRSIIAQIALNPDAIQSNVAVIDSTGTALVIIDSWQSLTDVTKDIEGCYYDTALSTLWIRFSASTGFFELDIHL